MLASRQPQEQQEQVVAQMLLPTKLNVTGLEELKLKDWYLVIANHQSWVDILVLQRVFNRKIPFLIGFYWCGS